jgi:hypothetical protein
MVSVPPGRNIRLSPVEREQRLLAIHHYTAATQDPVARAALDAALAQMRAAAAPDDPDPRHGRDPGGLIVAHKHRCLLFRR